MRLLVVEDDPILGDGIRMGLKQRGYTVDWVQDGEQARLALATEPYRGVILDLGLPIVSGLDLLRELRARHNNLPVLILTARDTISDRILGLDTGADDYVVKPFDLDELAARLRALLRRSSGRAEPLITHGPLALDPAAFTASLAGHPLELSPREFAVLKVLVENAGRVLSREQLEQTLYGWNEEIESNAIEVHIHHLRKKFGSEFIRTIRGVGYMIAKDRP